MPSRKIEIDMTSGSLKETDEIAKIFLEKIMEIPVLLGAKVVGLVGDLGAGKTTFMQSVAKHLGIKDRVRSPTFVIIKKYPLKNKKYDFLFHLDAYRLKDEKELLMLGWEEIIRSKKNLVFIEWPQNVSKVLPSHAKFIHICDDKDKKKHFKME